MAGFVRVPKLYKLVFEDYDGLQVRAKSVPIERFLSLLDLAEMKENPDAATAKKAINQLLEGFASALHDWNLQECPLGECPGPGCGYHHKDVPADFEGVKTQDTDFMLEVIDAWMTAIAGTPAPLSNSSSGTPPSGVASLPMEMLSASQAS